MKNGTEWYGTASSFWWIECKRADDIAVSCMETKSSLIMDKG